MADKADSGDAKGGKWPTWIIALVVFFAFGIVIFGLYSGGALNKVSIAGLLDVDFAPKTAPAAPVVSRDFILGQWQLQISPAGSNSSNGTSITYYPDGTLTGMGTEFQNGQGEQIPLSGTWSFQKLSDNEFRLSATMDGQSYQSRFRIFDANHIQNEDQNYMAVRVP